MRMYIIRHDAVTPFISTNIQLQGDRKVAQSEVWYLVFARNECGEYELVDEYICMAVESLCKDKHSSNCLFVHPVLCWTCTSAWWTFDIYECLWYTCL